MSMELGPYSNFHDLNLDWFLNEFNKVVEEWKAMEKSFDTLQNAFNDLKSYVQDYFKNLDVQDEIDNKLDEMAKSGALADIISEFVYRGYPTTTDLLSDSSLINNQYCMTLGFYNIGDEGGGLIFVNDTKLSDLFAIKTANNLYAHIIPTTGLNVKACGAYGDDTHDDSDVINQVLEFGDLYEIYFPKAFYKANFSINKIRTHITGNHARIHGSVTLNNNEITINNLDVESVDSIDGYFMFNKCRYVTLNGCYMYACNKSIIVNSDTYSEDNRHSIGLINIVNCNFLNCNYGIYIDYPYSDDSASWQKCNDWKISSCYFNNCMKSVIYSVGFDGLTFTNNTIFNVSNLNTRMESVNIINSDQLLFSNNSFFATGREAISLAHSRTTIISNNDFWGCGDFGYNIIKLTGVSDPLTDIRRCTITGNNFQYCNNVPINITSDDNVAVLSGNNYKLKNSPNTPSFQLNIDYFAYVANSDSVISDRCDLPYMKNSNLFLANNLYVKTNISTLTKTKICDFSPSFLGNVSINVFNDHVGTNVNNASYNYVCASNITDNGFKLVSSAGIINTASSGSKNWCGFTFEVSENALYATPIGVVQGDFVFVINFGNDLNSVL